MDTIDTPALATATLMCEACGQRPVYRPGDTFTNTAPTSAPLGQQRQTKAARYCYVCLERCGNAEDTYHRCRVCQPKPEVSQPDTSIRDNECHCSLVRRCALCRRAGPTTSAYNDGVNIACGCPQLSKCDFCSCCDICVGCHCNED